VGLTPPWPAASQRLHENASELVWRRRGPGYGLGPRLPANSTVKCCLASGVDQLIGGFASLTLSGSMCRRNGWSWPFAVSLSIATSSASPNTSLHKLRSAISRFLSRQLRRWGGFQRLEWLSKCPGDGRWPWAHVMETLFMLLVICLTSMLGLLADSGPSL
jgi:hypothetical protein